MEDAIIAAIVKELHQHYASALLRPSDKTAFGYGQAVGKAQGLAWALSIIKETLIKGEEDIERNS